MKKIKMNPEINDRLSSMMLWNGADEYLKAGRTLFENYKDKPNFMQFPGRPAYFVVCQAIELGLKAYLRASGEDEDFLVRICNHNLLTALKAAEDLGLTNLFRLEPEERGELDLANALYSSKALQFTIAGRYTLPHFETLLQIAEKLVVKTEKFCLNNVERHAAKPTAVTTLRAARKK